VLKKLPQGLTSPVKERGKNFSSGERQLISFARALVYKPSLMILDEATANIDSETETIIQQSLEKMMSLSTMIIVAHRLSTIQHSDRIIVMQKGEIKEMGTHQSLLQAKGLYYNLYLLQYDSQVNS
jgi:ATP-binding cassette subfamily B protein